MEFENIQACPLPSSHRLWSSWLGLGPSREGFISSPSVPVYSQGGETFYSEEMMLLCGHVVARDHDVPVRIWAPYTSPLPWPLPVFSLPAHSLTSLPRLVPENPPGGPGVLKTSCTLQPTGYWAGSRMFRWVFRNIFSIHSEKEWIEEGIKSQNSYVVLGSRRGMRNRVWGDG